MVLFAKSILFQQLVQLQLYKHLQKRSSRTSLFLIKVNQHNPEDIVFTHLMPKHAVLYLSSLKIFLVYVLFLYIKKEIYKYIIQIY